MQYVINEAKNAHIKRILLCAVIAGIATVISGLHIGNFSMEIMGAPVLSILMRMLITMIRPSLAESDTFKTGIKFTKKSYSGRSSSLDFL